MSLNTNLQSYWSFDNVSGTIVYDSSFNTVDGVFDGGAGLVANGKINSGGTWGYTYPLGPSKGSVNLGGAYRFERNEAFSVSFWAKRNTSAWYQQYQYMVSNKTNEPHAWRGWVIEMEGTGIRWRLANIKNIEGKNICCYDSSVLANTNWNHIVCTYDGSSLNTGMKIYLNSTLIGTQGGTLSETIVSSNQILRIGNSAPSNDTPFDGLLDEVGIWNTELDTDEINELYNGGTGLIYPFTIAAPSGLTVTDTTLTTGSITWVNNVSLGVNIVQLYNGSTWDDVETINVSATTYTYTGLDINTSYTVRVVSKYLTIEYPSSSVSFQTDYIPPLCDDVWENRLNVTGATCGNSDGVIQIINIYYFESYDIVLSDIQGAEYSFNETTGLATGLTSNYYFLIATPKPEYHDYYGGVTCEFNWIPLLASDTTMTLTNTSIRNASCGTFGGGSGRIVYFCADSGTTGSYTTKLYTELSTLVATVTGTTNSQIVFAGLQAGDYYAVMTNNNNNCTLLLGITTVISLKSTGVAGIKRIFVTEWNSAVEYNYWTAADEDYYVSGLDEDFFSSIKIKEFVDSTLPASWYEIVMDTKGATFGQVLNKTKQGFVFTSTLTITIPHADNTKWKTLVDFLQDRQIVVFLDNNGQYWCIGFSHGALADGYRRENNEYILTINAMSSDKILTNIDSGYVINNIIL